MSPADGIKPAQELLVQFQRARKSLRLYPVNNPIYAKTVEDTYHKLDDFVGQFGSLELKFRQNEILLGDKPVYQSQDKDDNLAFFFFKDGVREFTFQRGLTGEETRDFLQILSFDFERKGEDNDVVTLLWEKDFQHIKYLVDEKFILEDAAYEEQATSHAREELTDESELRKAYDEASRATQAAAGVDIMPITGADLDELLKEVERDSGEKVSKVAGILLELFFSVPAADRSEIVGFINEVLDFCVRAGDIRPAVHILATAKRFAGESSTTGQQKHELSYIFRHGSSSELVKITGEQLDSGLLTEGIFSEYVQLLDKEAIPPLITVLGEMKSIEARKALIEALVFLGRKDLSALARGLGDSRWYVVRNIIYIFRKIGDRAGVEFLMKAARHSDVRVRMEVLRGLGELGGPGVLQALREAFDDPEASIRTTAARALGGIGSEAAKKIILNKIGSRGFLEADFSEKKECFEILASWNDETITGFLMKTLKSRSFFRKARVAEQRACAAYGLGLLGCKEALPLLHRFRDSKNGLLSQYAYAAIKRIEYGQ